MAKTRSVSRRKAKKYQIELTPFWALLLSVFFFILLMWIFVLGILVGRGFLPGSVTKVSELKNQINKLQEMVSSRETYESSISEEADKNPELAFYEKLASKKEEVKNNWKPGESADIQEGETQAQDAEEINKSVPDRSDPIEVREQDGPETVSYSGQYTVQIASIGDIFRAEQLIKELKGQGYDAYYYMAQVNNKTYFRIRCGRFASRGEAQEYAKKLETEAGIEGFVSRVE
jgi:cell division septation protein DedD